MMNRGDAPTSSRARAVVIAGLTLATAWLAVNAVWGTTSGDGTMLSSWLRDVSPLPYWMLLGAVLPLAIGVTASILRSVDIQVFAYMVFSYVAGVTAAGFAEQWVDPKGGIPINSFADTIFALWQRSFLLWPAIPMAVVYTLYLREVDSSPMRFGDWNIRSKAGTSQREEKNWLLRFVAFALLLALPLALFMQASVGFGPAKSGTMFVYAIPLATLALFNGFTEELLFRGFLQSAFSRYLGSDAGILAQGLFFGFHHWGASPDLIAGLPTAIVLCGLGVLWGYSVRETGGIGWAVCTHALVDFAFFSAHFVTVG